MKIKETALAPVSRQSLYYKCLPTVMSHSAEKKKRKSIGVWVKEMKI